MNELVGKRQVGDRVEPEAVNVKFIEPVSGSWRVESAGRRA
jgi:hypothetical protein